MKNTKLLRLLKTFSGDEWKSFTKFAASPYFNKGRNYIPFIKELRKFYPGFDSDKLNKEFIYRKLFPGKQFKETVINTLSSGLYFLAEEFLVQESLKENSKVKLPILIRSLSGKGLKNEVDNMIVNIEKRFANKMYSYYDYFDKFVMYQEIYDHYFLNDERMKTSPGREKSNIFLVRYLIHELITTEKEFICEKNFMKYDYRNKPLGKIISKIDFAKIIVELEKENKKETLVLLIYFNVLLAFKFPENDSYYYKAKFLINANYSLLDTDLRTRCYFNLVSICNEKTLYGKPEWNKEAFEVFKKILGDKLYYMTGGGVNIFPKSLFRNILESGLNNKEIEWTKKFVNDYINKTDPQFKDALYNFSMAKIEYEEKNYESTINYINKIPQDQIIYKIETKNLLSKLYYTTNTIESLYSLLDSYLHLLNNSGIENVPLVKRHINFVRSLKKLLNIKTGKKDETSLKLLKINIQKSQFLNNKTWLLEKINEFDNIP